MVALDSKQTDCFSQALAATDNWCVARGLDPTPYRVRVALCGWTESRGHNESNDGLAFADNFAQVRPGWAEGLPVNQRRVIRDTLRQSLDINGEDVGNNGGSTGMYQQLSQDYVGLRFPGKTWGYGSIADTMDITKATEMFLEKLQVTNNPVYMGITFSDPITADILRVQQPLVSESSSSNYNADQVAIAREIVVQFATVDPYQNYPQVIRFIRSRML